MRVREKNCAPVRSPVFTFFCWSVSVGARRKGRELALQMLYQWEVDAKPVREIASSISELQRAGDDARAFARRLVEGTLRRMSEIDALLAEQSEGWRLERMAAVDRNILRLAKECEST